MFSEMWIYSAAPFYLLSSLITIFIVKYTWLLHSLILAPGLLISITRLPWKRLTELIITCILSSIAAILNPEKKHGLLSVKTDLQELATDCERDLAIAKSSGPCKVEENPTQGHWQAAVCGRCWHHHLLGCTDFQEAEKPSKGRAETSFKAICKCWTRCAVE